MSGRGATRINLDWKGTTPEEAVDSLDVFLKLADTQFYKATVDAKDEVVSVAKQNAPVDTGTLRDSIEGTVRTDGGDIILVVGSPVEYAVYVEFGTSKMEAQPYLRPALEEVEKDYRGKIVDAIKRADGLS